MKIDIIKFYEVYYFLLLISFIGLCIKIKNISKFGYFFFFNRKKIVGLIKSKVIYIKLSFLWDVLILVRFVESESF